MVQHIYTASDNGLAPICTNAAILIWDNLFEIDVCKT